MISKRRLQEGPGYVDGTHGYTSNAQDPAASGRCWCSKCKTYAAKNRKRNHNHNYYPAGKLEVDQFILPTICEALCLGGTSTFLTPGQAASETRVPPAALTAPGPALAQCSQGHRTRCEAEGGQSEHLNSPMCNRNAYFLFKLVMAAFSSGYLSVYSSLSAFSIPVRDRNSCTFFSNC